MTIDPRGGDAALDFERSMISYASEKRISLEGHNDHFEPSIYIGYTLLKATDFAKILDACDNIYDEILSAYSRLFNIDFVEYRPVLKILEIKTGNSIIFRFSEGWLPTFSSTQENIIVTVPRKLGIPLLISYLLLYSISQVIELRSKYLDMEIKKVELQLREHEIVTILNENDLTSNLQIKSDTVVDSLIKNHTFLEVRINGIQIK
jgi:hypothetical protein